MLLFKTRIKELLFFAVYYRQISGNIKMKNNKTDTSFVVPDGRKDLANKTGIDFIIFILKFLENNL